MADDSPDEPTTFHRFLDEAGDTTFYGSKRKVIIGEKGVSRAFYLGAVKFMCPLESARMVVEDAKRRVVSMPELNRFPSVKKRIAGGGFYFHAKDDPPPIRQLFFDELRDLSCRFEVLVARKNATTFERLHKNNADAFYAEILGHLLKRKLKMKGRIVLNIAQRGSSTRSVILESALQKARERAQRRWPGENLCAKVVFNVQNPRREPLLSIADYFGWAVQRVCETGDASAYDLVRHKKHEVHDIFDGSKYRGNRNWYNPSNPLTAGNKIGPPAP